MSKRPTRAGKVIGVTRIADLFNRSKRLPGSDCWWWVGAMACDKVSPRIWTVDHDRSEKRSMSGPAAVWNISRGVGLRGRLAFMRCVNSSCVNPVHVKDAASKAEIGAHISATGRRKGKNVEQNRANIRKAWDANGVTPTPSEIVLAIRAAGPGVSTQELARLHGISRSAASRIRRGESHKELTL